MEDPELLAGDCAVICTCCPCSLVLQILLFLLIRLPCKLAKRSKKLVLRRLRKRPRRGRRRRCVPAGRRRGGLVVDGPALDDEVGAAAEEEDVDDHGVGGATVPEAEALQRGRRIAQRKVEPPVPHRRGRRVVSGGVGGLAGHRHGERRRHPVYLQQRRPFIAFQALSDLAGGGLAQPNEASVFADLAAGNAAAVAVKFISLLD